MTQVTAPTTPSVSVGRLLREWRERRRLSQLELAGRAAVSTRHLSYVETGRSQPTPAMILKLSEHLDVPLRERNELLLAGGFAPAYPEHPLGSAELATVLAALRQVVDAHPYPALVLDRGWDLVDANAALGPLLIGAAPYLLEPPVNVLRLSLHPDGLAPRIRNLAQWRAHLLDQLAHRAEHTGDPRLYRLHAELLAYPGGLERAPDCAVVVPLRIAVPSDEADERTGGEMALFSLASSVQTAADVTVAELTVETFYPVDAASESLLRSLLQPRNGPGSGSRSPAGR